MRTTKKPTEKKTTAKKAVASAPVVVARRRPSGGARPKVSAARLKELIEEATVDAYNESEQRVPFLTMIQNNLKVPWVRLFCGGEVFCKFDHLILRSRGLGAGSGSGITPWA